MPRYLLRTKPGNRVVGEVDGGDGTMELMIEDPSLAQAVTDFVNSYRFPGGEEVDAVPVEGNILASDCNPDEHRTCDLTLAVTWAAEFAQEHGIPAPRLMALADGMAASDEDEVRDALEELVRNTPNDPQELREEANGYLTFLWPDAGLASAV